MKVFFLLLAVAFIPPVLSAQSQTLPELQPPITLHIQDPEAPQAMEQAAFNFAVRLSALIYLYQGWIEDESIKRQLASHDQFLTILISRGELSEHVGQMDFIQQNVRRIIREAIEQEREWLEDQQERELFDSEIQQLRERSEPLDIFRDHLGFLQGETEFQRFEILENRTLMVTGESEQASEIHFETEFIPDNDFYLQIHFQLTDYRPLVWNPSSGLIFGSDGGDNYYLLKINSIENGIDFQAVNDGRSDDMDLFFPVENLNVLRAGNELGVYRRKNLIYMFLNKELIFEASSLPLYGKYIGIYADPGLELSVIRFHLYQGMP